MTAVEEEANRVASEARINRALRRKLLPSAWCHIAPGDNLSV